MPLPPGLARPDPSDPAVTLLNRGRWRNPDVFLVQTASGRVVVKDFAPRSAPVRLLLGRWITSRELRAYRALEGHPAVPRALGRIDALALAVEYRPGRRMSRRLAADLPPGFVPALERAVREMHARGVAHLDLRHRSNVMIDDAGCPVLIDFASAVCLRPGSLAARWLLPLVARIDLAALAKWRERLAPGSRAAGQEGSR